jgi:hypothetical protein
MGWSLLPNAMQPLRSIVLPEFKYYLEVNIPIKFCSETYFFRLEVFLTSLKSQTRDPSL